MDTDGIPGETGQKDKKNNENSKIPTARNLSTPDDKYGGTILGMTQNVNKMLNK
jgi:hypothetical protein